MASADELHAFLRTRRSVRRFQPDPVADAAIARLIATATHAPSAHNLRPWRFVVIRQRSDEFSHQLKTTEIVTTSITARDDLAGALTSALRADMTRAGAPEAEIEKRVAVSLRRIAEAPVIILLCRDRSAVRADTTEERIMSIQSTAAAGTYLLLAAHAEGLGASWVCWPLYAMEETRAALSLPETWDPQAMVFVGVAAT